MQDTPTIEQGINCTTPVTTTKGAHAATRHGGLRKSPNKWTQEENQKLSMLVTKYGEKKWKRIAVEMGAQKTGAQCAQHWKRVSSPDIRKGPWDENEESLLFRMVTQYVLTMYKDHVGRELLRKSHAEQCRYQYLKAKQSREVKWAAREDEALIKKVLEMVDRIIWLEVAEHMAKLKHTSTIRTALECKERYFVLLGLGITPRVQPRAEYCVSPTKRDVQDLECSALPGFSITIPARFHMDRNDSKEKVRPGLQLQLVADNGATSEIFVFEKNVSIVSAGCCQKCCCSPCSQHKQQPWDLESLATIASVLPREI